MPAVNLPVLDYREYQKPLIRYMRGGLTMEMTPEERSKCRRGKKAVWVAHRRSGKDVTCWQYVVEAAMEDKGPYFYCLPEFTHARRVIWEGMLNDGMRFLDLVPKKITKTKNESQMKIELINGSILQLVGSDQYDRLVGTNPKGIVFSEYALTHPMAWQILRPIFALNDGWAIFNSTPRGKNHFYDLLMQAKQNKNWFWSVDTVDSTKIVSKEILDEERKDMDPMAFQQEYHCSFDAANQGAYYAEQLVALRNQNRLCKVPYVPELPVYTVSDPGDVHYARIYFQVLGKEIRLIDAEEMFSPSPETIFAKLQEKPYRYATHFLPSDAEVKKMAAGQRSHVDQLSDIGMINIQVLPAQSSKMEGIKMTQSAFPSFWVDEKLEVVILEPLGNYAPKFYEKRNTFSDEPEHNWASHMSDAVRYLVIAVKEFLSYVEDDERPSYKSPSPRLG